MSKVKIPRHVEDVIAYLRTLGIEPDVRHGKHYVLKWKHGSHHGRVVVQSTPRDVGDSYQLAIIRINQTIRASFA